MSGSAPSGRLDHAHKERRGEPWQELVGRFAAGPVAIEHQRQHPDAGLYKKCLLLGGERSPHEGDGRYAEGVKAEHRPIPLDEHQVLGAGCPVKAEEDPALLEPARQIVFRDAFRWIVAGPAACIRHEHAALIVDRNADTALHGAVAAVPEAEGSGELRTDAPPCQIRMRWIEREPKRQRPERQSG